MKMKLLAALIAATTMSATTANAEVKVSTKGGLKVESGDYKFEFGGRIQYDYNRAERNGEVRDEDGFDIRRARVFARGNISENWKFKTQFNVNSVDEQVEDLYLRYTGFGKAANITIGNQKQPFGLEELTSSKDISILERSALTELFAPGRQEGIQLHGKLSGNQTYGIGVYFAEGSQAGTAQDLDDEVGDDIGFAARYTIAPIKTDTSVFHLGAAYNTIEDVDAFGFEVAYSSGPFHIQAEYIDGTTLDEQENAIDDDLVDLIEVDSDGFYIQAGYILTGETRPYSGGKFKRVKPGSKAGAWEVVVRYEDGNGAFGDIELSDQIGDNEASSVGVGVNYYAHKNVRIGVNYTDGEVDSGSNDGRDGNEFRVRFQLTF